MAINTLKDFDSLASFCLQCYNRLSPKHQGH